MYKIMVVDDEPQVRVALSQIINIIGRPGEFYVQEQAANGRIALEKLRERQVDIVLSDISMPVMTGLGLADHLMREYPHIVTIFLSGYGDFSLAQKSFQYRVFDYVLKPIDPEALLLTLRRAGEEVDRRRMSQKSRKLMLLCKSGVLQRIQERIGQKDFAVAIGTAQKQNLENLIRDLYWSLVSSDDSLDEHRQVAYWLFHMLGGAYAQMGINEAEEADLEEKLLHCASPDHVWKSLDGAVLQVANRYSQRITQRSHLDNIKEYICQEYANVISLQTLADKFSLSPSYISEMFKENGQNFLDFLTERRLEVAMKLLKEDRYKIHQIARMVGYNDANYFNKLFKKHVGISPGEFRNKVIG